MQKFLRSIVNVRHCGNKLQYSTRPYPAYDEAVVSAMAQKEHLIRHYTHPQLSYTTTTTSYPLVLDTINDHLNKRAQTMPSRMMLGFPHQGLNLTFGDLKQRVDVAAQNLLDLGFNKGDRIGFVMPNSYEFVVGFLAAAQIGLISVALNPAYQLVEFEYMLKKTGVKGLVIYDTFKTLQHLEIVRKICPELDSSKPGELNSKRLPELRHVFVLNSPLVPTKQTYKGTWPFSVITEAKSTNIKHQIPYVEMDDPCLILFTSGTTGKPKGATITQSSLLNSAYLTTVLANRPESLRMVCNPVPMFHIFGLATGLMIPLLMGSTKVLPFYFPEITSTMKAIQGYKCNALRGTPTQFVDLLNHPLREKFDLSSLEYAIVGGSSVAPELVNDIKQKLKIKSVVIGYGMTETSYCHTCVSAEDEQREFKLAYESVGRAMPYSESKIVDPQTGQMLPHNMEGELYIRGPHIIKGYWDEPEKSKETIDKDGWLHTGDVFTMDKEGFLFFKSRHKDVIIRGGANIYPAEIENYLCTHPSISDAHVFGVPDERLQEEVCAWVKLAPGCKLTEQELKDYCKNKISHFKIPRYVKFVEAYPINANNKILKNVMREKAAIELKLVK